MTEQSAAQHLDEAAIKARNRRNLWLALALVAFVVVMGVGTAIRISEGAGVSACEGSFYWDMDSNSCIEERPEPDLEAISKGAPG